MADAIGVHGLTAEALADRLARTKPALERLREQRAAGTVPFLSLPDRRDDLAVINALVNQASRKFSDLVILGTHGHGMVASLLLGSVAEGMVRKAVIPTMIIPVKDKD